MTHPDVLLDVIGDIYSVPGNAAAWTALMPRFYDLATAGSVTYYAKDLGDDALSVSAVHGFTAEDIALYEGELGKNDIRNAHLHLMEPGCVYREFEVISDRAAYDDNQFIQYLMRTHGFYYALGAKVSTHGLWLDMLALNRRLDDGPFPDEEKAAIQCCLPHVARAVELHRPFARLKSHYGLVLSVLDRLRIGLLIVDKRGRVIVANEAARGTCEESAAIVITRGGVLRLIDSAADGELRALIHGTSETAVGAGRSDGGTVLLRRDGGRAPLLLEASPVRDDGLPDSDNIRGTAIFIVDPERSGLRDSGGLAQLFGLSEAERSVADKLVQGHRVSEIAEQRGTTLETVKSQVKAILHKAGAENQADLVRLAAKVDPPVERFRR